MTDFCLPRNRNVSATLYLGSSKVEADAAYKFAESDRINNSNMTMTIERVILEETSDYEYKVIVEGMIL